MASKRPGEVHHCRGKAGACGARLHRANKTGLCAACFRAVAAKERARAPRVCAGCGAALHRQTRTDHCVACYRAARRAEAEAAVRRCSTAGCGAPLSKANKTGVCARCVATANSTDRADRAARIAAGVASDEEVLRRDNTELRRRVSALSAQLDQASARANLEDRLLANVLEFVERNPYRPQLHPAPAEAPSAKEHEMLLLLSDAHSPEVVDPEAAFGLVYNPDIARRRIEYARDKAIRYRDLRASAYPTRKLTVGVIGDMLSGDIHEELEVTNAEPVTESVVSMAHLLFEVGSTLREVFPRVEMVIIPGNHARVTKKPRFKQKWNAWEYLMGRFVQSLAVAAKVPDLEVTVPKAIVYRHRIFDQTIGLSHGDGVKAASFAGIPWYAMKQRRDALQSLLKTVGLGQLDLLCYGHFHQLIFEEGAGCSLVINGSIKGGDEFSIGTRYSAQPPVQALLTFHPRHGITDLSRINLGHIS